MSSKKKFTLSVDYKVLTIVLAIILVLLVAWLRPWAQTAEGQRDVSVTGEAVLSAEPDKYVFYPIYEFKNTNQEQAKAALTSKTNEVINGLRSLGVAESDIKSGANNYDAPNYPEISGGEPTYTIQLTITVADRELAQAVQDYVLSTNATGNLTPYPTFSEEKRKELEDQAREIASKDARKKAEQLAENLGFRLGKVKTIEEQSGFGDVIPLDSTLRIEDSSTQELPVQPGENELTFTLRVVYFLN